MDYVCIFLIMLHYVAPSTATIDLNEGTTAFLFDLHDVCIEKSDKFEALRQMICKPREWLSYLKTFASCIVHLNLEQLTVAWKTLPVINDKHNFALLLETAQRNHNDSLFNLLINIEQPIKIKSGMLELLTTLKKSNYKLYIGSNIAEQIIAEHIRLSHEDKNRSEIKTLFECFEQGPHNRQVITFNNIHPQNTPDKGKAGMLIRKPDRLFFDQAKQTIGPNNTIIFVDDKQENVDAATKANMEGVLFINLDDFKSRLRTKGLLENL